MNRCRIETLNIILTISIKGIKKTHIMHKANLSHKQLEKSLEVLTSKGLLLKDGDSYKTTDKGLAFIEEFAKIQSLMGERNTRANSVNGALPTPILHLVNLVSAKSKKNSSTILFQKH